MNNNLSELEKDLIHLLRDINLDTDSIIPMMLLLRNNVKGQLKLLKYLRTIDPNNYNKSKLFRFVDDLSRQANETEK